MIWHFAKDGPFGKSMNGQVDSNGFPTHWFVAVQMAGFMNHECPLLSLPILHCMLVFHTCFLLSLVYLCLRAVSLLVCMSLGYSRYMLSFVEDRRDTCRVHKGGSFITGLLSTAPADTSGRPPMHRSRLAVTCAHGVSWGEALVWDGCTDGRHIMLATSMMERDLMQKSGTSSLSQCQRNIVKRTARIAKQTWGTKYRMAIGRALGQGSSWKGWVVTLLSVYMGL